MTTDPAPDYFNNPPKTRLLVAATPAGLTVTLPRPRPTSRFWYGEILFLVLNVAGIAVACGFFSNLIFKLLFLYLIWNVWGSIRRIRRRAIPRVLEIASGKLTLVTPHQSQLHHEFMIDKEISVRPSQQGAKKTGPAELGIEQDGRKVAAIFRYLPQPELQWISDVINSALHPPEPVQP